MRERQQNSATYHILIYMVLSIDHLTPATGKTVTATLSKNGAGFGAAAGAVSEIGSGFYKLAANATDSNTLGALGINATATGCDPFVDEYQIVGYDPFDAVRLGLTALPNAAAGANGGLPTGDASGRVLLQPTQAGVTIPTVTTTTTATDLTNAPTNGDFTAVMKASLNAATPSVTVSDKTGFSLSLAGVQAFFDSVVTFNTAGSVGKLWNDLLTAINTVTAKFHFTGGAGVEKVNAQVAGMDTDVITSAALSASAVAEIVNGVWDELLAGHTTPASAAQLLIAAGSVGTPPTVSQIVNGILNELLAGHTTAGSVAVAIALINSVYALLIGVSSIEVNDDFDSEGNLHLTKYQTYSAANGNRPTLTVSVTVDPTAATARWTFLQNGVATPISAEFISYDSGTALAVYALSMTSAETGALTAKAGGRDTGSFSLSVFLGGVNVLVPVPYPNGKLIVSDAPAPP